MFVYLGDQMRLIVAGQVPNVQADRILFFQDIALLLQALVGLAIGENQVCYSYRGIPSIFRTETEELVWINNI